MHKDECVYLIHRLSMSRFPVETYRDAFRNESQFGSRCCGLVGLNALLNWDKVRYHIRSMTCFLDQAFSIYKGKLQTQKTW
jgi:hypothetical protein